MNRVKLPDTRRSITTKREVCGFDMYVVVGFYPTRGDDLPGWTPDRAGQPAEVFCVLGKQGTEVSGVMDGLAVSVSMGLQHGVPWSVIRDKFLHSRFGRSDERNTSLLDGFAKAVDACLAELPLPEVQS